jgi:hypothetical protein
VSAHNSKTYQPQLAETKTGNGKAERHFTNTVFRPPALGSERYAETRSIAVDMTHQSTKPEMYSAAINAFNGRENVGADTRKTAQPDLEEDPHKH